MKTSSQPRPPDDPLSTSVFHQLNVYALAASAAGVGMLALAQPADARIIYTKAYRYILVGDSYHLDLNHDGKVDFTLYHEPWKRYLDVSTEGIGERPSQRTGQSGWICERPPCGESSGSVGQLRE